jgi:hypothetical protein
MIQSVFHLDDFWNNRSENQNINQLENLGLEKKKPEIFILSRGFVFNRNASVHFGGDAGTRTPDTADMSRML